MGAVYKAQHIHTGQLCAVKGLRAELTEKEEHIRRFENEAQMPGRIAHPGVVHTAGAYRAEDGTRFIAMELLDGQDLSQRLERGALDLRTALGIGRKLCEIVDAVHAASLVHRDIKPANIFLSDHGDALQVTLLDFGIALDLTKPSQGQDGDAQDRVTGSPPYLSPEQARAHRADPCSDVYAVGAVLFELMTGERIFEGRTVYELLWAAAMRDAPRVSTLRWIPRAIRADLDALVARCLEKDPDARPQSAHEVGMVLRELEQHLRTRPECRVETPFAASFFPPNS